MKKLTILMSLIAVATISMAQDTAYVSKDRFTAMFFPRAVSIVGKPLAGVSINQKENALITLKAKNSFYGRIALEVRELNTSKTFRILIVYNDVHAGQRIEIGQTRQPYFVRKAYGFSYSIIANNLTSGKRKEIADRKKVGGVKVWVNRISLAGNKLFFRVDVRNRSKLPYEIDFVRFYIRDLKTVDRMASHEQEIVPFYSTLGKREMIGQKKEIATAFVFKRFSLSKDQALNIELYERNGNRHICLQVKQNDLDDLKIIQPIPQRPASYIAAVTTIN